VEEEEKEKRSTRRQDEEKPVHNAPVMQMLQARENVVQDLGHLAFCIGSRRLCPVARNQALEQIPSPCILLQCPKTCQHVPLHMQCDSLRLHHRMIMGMIGGELTRMTTQ
jgi:hypothetical protein